MTNEWRDSVWSCFSPAKACFLGTCCPCLIYGRQSERLEDPALKEGSYVNGDCCLFVLANYCCLSWVLMMMKRRGMREKFGLKGSVGEDCILTCLCPCCVLVQQEKELDAQAEKFMAQPPVGYQAPAGMAYSPGEKGVGNGAGNGPEPVPVPVPVPHPEPQQVQQQLLQLQQPQVQLQGQTTGTMYTDASEPAPTYPVKQ